MWHMERRTESSFQAVYQVKSRRQTFPLDILGKMRELTETMKDFGIIPELFISVCGKEVVLQGADKHTLSPQDSSSVWKNIITIRAGEDRFIVLAAMCFIILLTMEGYYKSVTIDKGVKQDGTENKELWETAWGIINQMKEKYHGKVQDDKEVERC